MSKFKVGDKAEFKVGNTWVPVSIQSEALQWVNPHCGSGHLYLVEHTHVHLAHSDRLRPAEVWVKCEGTHRFADRPEWGQPIDMERLVEEA